MNPAAVAKPIICILAATPFFNWSNGTVTQCQNGVCTTRPMITRYAPTTSAPVFIESPISEEVVEETPAASTNKATKTVVRQRVVRVASDVCPCGCGMVGCNCGRQAATTVYHSGYAATPSAYHVHTHVRSSYNSGGGMANGYSRPRLFRGRLFGWRRW